jgi:hypothetical protein
MGMSARGNPRGLGAKQWTALRCNETLCVGGSIPPLDIAEDRRVGLFCGRIGRNRPATKKILRMR